MSWGLHAVDWSRRVAGIALDLLGMGPVQTPSQIVRDRPGFLLRRYEPSPTSGFETADKPPILIIPAPIKRAYIWDIAPRRSVVRTAMCRGWRVYLLDWRRPVRTCRGWGLDQYADAFPAEAVEAVQQDTGRETVNILAHSLGGTLAAIYASLHAETVSAMVLIESPLSFGPRDDAFAPLVAAAPSSNTERLLGTAPGVLLNLASGAAAPEVFQWFRTVDQLVSLSSCDRLLTHARVERWTLDEFAMPGRLLDETVERLYRADQFMKGTLEINGQTADPRAITMPVLNVFNPHSRLITAEMVRSFHAVLPNPRSAMMHTHSEPGTGLEHVGPLVGSRAHRELWPRILEWMGSSVSSEHG